jgi:hypothetical protein
MSIPIAAPIVPRMRTRTDLALFWRYAAGESIFGEIIAMGTFDQLAARLQRGFVTSSIGTTEVSLAVALDRFRAAEESLDNAREAARQAARREGKKTSGLFAGGLFVSRANMEKMVDEARAEGDSAGFERGCEHVAAAAARSADLKRAAAKDRAEHRQNFYKATPEEILAAGERARAGGSEWSKPTGLAKQIVNAGRRRRNEPEIE